MSITEPLKVGVRYEGRVAVVSAAGEVDVYTAPLLRDGLLSATSRGTAWVLADLTDVSFMDSTGLGVMVGGLKRTRVAGGRLDLAGLTDHVAALFTRTGLARVFVIHPDAATGMQAITAAMEASAPADTSGKDSR